ncbi:uridylate kinase [Striga asiatica]|uniref:Uridylate kinase n=1 Tax=Striga asiatica TaxID=4170 RepID=A0A5A7RJK9_STRAF|nr:uridylate kinase [Striga asiatica]
MTGLPEPEVSGAVEPSFPIPGKRGRKDVPPQIFEVKQDELIKNRPREDQVKMMGVAFGPAYQPASTKNTAACRRLMFPSVISPMDLPDDYQPKYKLEFTCSGRLRSETSGGGAAVLCSRLEEALQRERKMGTLKFVSI